MNKGKLVYCPVLREWQYDNTLIAQFRIGREWVDLTVGMLNNIKQYPLMHVIIEDIINIGETVQ